MLPEYLNKDLNTPYLHQQARAFGGAVNAASRFSDGSLSIPVSRFLDLPLAEFAGATGTTMSAGPSNPELGSSSSSDPLSVSIEAAQGVKVKIVVERRTQIAEDKAGISIQVFEGGAQAQSTNCRIERNGELLETSNRDMAPAPAPVVMAMATPSTSARKPETAIDLEQRISEAIRRRTEHFKKSRELLDKEREMLEIGRSQLINDIKRHQIILDAKIGEVNQKLETERRNMIVAIERELELFKLPTIKRLVRAEPLDNLIAEGKRIGQQCNRMCM